MAFNSGGTGPDYARIKAALANSRIQSENNALYQCIFQLIDAQKKFQDLVLSMFAGTEFGDLIQNISNLTGNIELQGDVVGGPSPSPVSTTIQPDVVTYAKMQNVSAASRLLGRGSLAGAGDVEEILLGSGLTMTDKTLSASGFSSTDYVVMSDGNTPPAPMDDGNGNFIYTTYTP